jgi:hypothetical protein
MPDCMIFNFFNPLRLGVKINLSRQAAKIAKIFSTPPKNLPIS